MWCPECGCEYEKGFTMCSDCGCALTDKEPEKTLIDGVDIQNLVCLCEAGTDFDADVKIALLRSYGIKAFKRYSPFASVAKIYCGSSNLGVMLYVPSESYADAKEIIDAPFDKDDFSENAYGEAKDEED